MRTRYARKGCLEKRSCRVVALVLMFGALIERPFFNGILSIIRLRNVTSRYLIETLYKCGQYDLVQHMFESTLRRKSDTVIKVPSSWAKN